MNSITVPAEMSAIELFAGRYDVVHRCANRSYRRESQGLPCGLQRVSQGLDLRVGGALKVELSAAAVRFQATLNGSDIPDGASALLALRTQRAEGDTDDDDGQSDWLEINVPIDDTLPLYMTRRGRTLTRSGSSQTITSSHVPQRLQFVVR